MDEFVLTGSPRSEFGRKATRRLRREGRLPVNIYGHKETNVNASLDAREFRRFFEDGHRMATLEIDGKQEHGVVKEVQYDGLGNEILHVDFTRVSRDEKIEIEVPFEIVGVVAGGVVDFAHREVRILGLPGHLPAHIELRVSALKIGAAIRVTDVPEPADCQILDDRDLVVFAVHAPKGVETSEDVSAEDAPSEPEIIGKPKDEDEDKA